MKFAIDKRFDKGVINGWVSSENEKSIDRFLVDIFTPQGRVFSAKPDTLRLDVKSAGLHPTGNCGFSFNAKEAGVRDGDLILVKIYDSKSLQAHTHSFIFGDQNKATKIFHQCEYDRDDFTILEKSTHEILLENNHLLALKLLLIRLRRHKRSILWRGEFRGVNYLHGDTDWELFKTIISNYREAIFSSLSTRYIFSIIDTVADFSDQEERLAALSLSMMMVYERFSHSLFLIYEKDRKNSPDLNKQINVWGGMLSNNLSRDDALDIFLTRMTCSLKNYPYLLSYFYEIVLRAMKEENSLLFENISNSEYFSDAWSFYRAQFEKENKLMLASV